MTRNVADYLLWKGVVVLPCKVGDMVYFVERNSDIPIGIIDEIEIVMIGKTESGFCAKGKIGENTFDIPKFEIDNHCFFASREEAKKRADEIATTASETSKSEADRLINESKEKIEQERIQVTKDGYADGHKEGLEKIQEELEEKINSFDKFCQNQLDIKDKIIKSASKDIFSLITNISKKVLLKEVDSVALDKIIKNTISLLDKKENVTLILSEKYARLLFELQQKALDEEKEFNFENFKQYDGFDVIYNPKFADDTIIVENLKERFDASINSQLDILIRDIYENSKNGNFDMEQYIDNATE